MANFNIYIPQKYEPILEGLSQDGESIGQVIKRLVLGMLDGDDRPQSSPLPPDIGDRLTNLEKQLTHVTEQVEGRFALCSQDGDRLDKIDQHWESAKWMILEAQGKIKSLESDLYHGESLAFKEIRDDIKRLQTAIANLSPNPAPQETAIMIQKQPLPTADPAPTPTEITLTHEEAACEFKRTAQTVKRWSSDPNKWPPGWLYDGDKQFWTKG